MNSMKDMFLSLKTSKGSYNDLIVVEINGEEFWLTGMYHVRENTWYWGVCKTSIPNSSTITKGEFIGIIEDEAMNDEWRDDIYVAPIDAVLQGKAKFVILETTANEVEDILFEPETVIYTLDQCYDDHFVAKYIGDENNVIDLNVLKEFMLELWWPEGIADELLEFVAAHHPDDFLFFCKQKIKEEWNFDEIQNHQKHNSTSILYELPKEKREAFIKALFTI